MNEVKVSFELEIEEDGFPPISVETLNARLISETTIELDNTPFFAKSVAVGDIINCRQKNGDEKILEYDYVITGSGNRSISIIFIDDCSKEGIYQYLRSCGCYCEYGEFDGFNMLAVSIGKDADYDNIAAYLDGKEADDVISYAELCV